MLLYKLNPINPDPDVPMTSQFYSLPSALAT